MSRTVVAITIAALAALVLAGAYLFLGEGERGGIRAGPDGRIAIEISAATLLDELPLYEATAGDTVTLVLTADSAGEAHLHGYERLVPITPGQEATIELEASETGLFRIAFHAADGSEREAAMLWVRPR